MSPQVLSKKRLVLQQLPTDTTRDFLAFVLDCIMIVEGTSVLELLVTLVTVIFITFVAMDHYFVPVTCYLVTVLSTASLERTYIRLQTVVLVHVILKV